jgi:beta-1,4-N-acetylglucosaminyltransferase
MTKTRSIFVTVGTTRFDRLIDSVTRPEALEWMTSNGYTDLIIQYGKGNEPLIPKATKITVRSYSFQPSLDQDMRTADLIISHAGAGTVMEALKWKKRLVVVINTDLMDNHQMELAHAMAKRGHLFVVDTPTDLGNYTLWNEFNTFQPTPHQGGDPHAFPRLLNQHMGVLSEES